MQINLSAQVTLLTTKQPKAKRKFHFQAEENRRKQKHTQGGDVDTIKKKERTESANKHGGILPPEGAIWLIN